MPADATDVNRCNEAGKPGPSRVLCYKPIRSSAQVVPGYSYANDPTLSYEKMVELLLPVSLLDQLQSELDSRMTPGAESDKSDVTDGDDGDIWAIPKGQLKLDANPATGSRPEASPGQSPSDDPVPLDGAHKGRSSLPVAVFNPNEIKALSGRIQTRAKSERPRLEEIEKRLKALGHWRHLLVPACQEQPEMFNHLLERYPHFSEVISLYRTSAKAAAALGKVMAPPPVLMLGVPGLGKTHFAQALAACMSVPLVRLSFDTGLTNSELVGSDQHWSNTHHGKLFDQLCLHPIANPLFLLDELDKASMHYGMKGQSSIAALHTCLEPTSASAVLDISVGFTMDVSHTVWLAAANQADLIPQSIRSRFTEVTIRPPIKPHEMYQLNWHVSKAVVEPMNMQMPTSEIRTSLAVLSPREQRKYLQAACQSAAAEGRDWVVAGDFAPGVIEAMELGQGPKRGKGPGRGNGKAHSKGANLSGDFFH